jgi:hypothetical protein
MKNDRFQRFMVMAGLLFVLIATVQIGLLQIDPRASAALKAAFGPTAASWGQALGTVIAFTIAFAIAIGENDRDRERRKEMAQERRVRTRVLARQLAQIADQRMRAAKMAFDGDPLKHEAAGWALTQRTVEADLAVIRALNPHDLEEIKPMQTFALLIGLMRSTCDLLEPLAQGSLERKSTFKPYVLKTKQAIGQLQEEVSNLAARLDQQLNEIETRPPADNKPPRKALWKPKGRKAAV